MSYPRLIENLISHLMKLPGVGRRSAERMVFWFLNTSPEDTQSFCQNILALKERMRLCTVCNHLSEKEVCEICENPGRDQTIICVVEDHKHLLAIERSGMYRGVYHVLLGAISPTEGRGPEDLRLERLMKRIQEKGVKEVVMATDPDTEGEMTALHIMKELRPLGVKVTRIGLGIPVGSSVEYADASTLALSMSSRRVIE
ncbi:MAG: recombination mediator RecR [Candidatus Omnitrophica bacterium]|nr:recombination mediator RecR [Candidatus Omnitrophota bacterium]